MAVPVLTEEGFVVGGVVETVAAVEEGQPIGGILGGHVETIQIQVGGEEVVNAHIDSEAQVLRTSGKRGEFCL